MSEDAENNSGCLKCIILKSQLEIEKREVQYLNEAMEMEKENFTREFQLKKQLSEIQPFKNPTVEKNSSQEKVLSEKCDSIQKKNEELLQYIYDLEESNASYLSQLETLNIKVDQLNLQLKNALQQNTDLSNSVNSYDEQIKQLNTDYQQKIDSQTDKITSLNNQLSVQEEKVSRLSEVDARLCRMSLNSSLAGGCVSCANLIETNKRLSEMVESARHQENEHCAKIQELNDLVSSLTQDKNQLKEDKKNLENKCDRYFDAKFTMQEKLKEEQSIMEELRNKIDKQSDTIISLQSQKDVEGCQEKKVKANMESTINLLKARAREDRELFDNKMKELTSEIRHHKETIRDLNRQVHDLSDNDNQLKNYKVKMTKHVQYLEGQIRSLKEECSSHITECTELKRQKTDLLDQLYLTDNKCDELECDKKDCEAKMDNLNKEIFKLEETSKQQAKLIDFLRGDSAYRTVDKKNKKATLASILKSTPRLPDSRSVFQTNRALSHSDLFMPETPSHDRNTVRLEGAKKLF